MTMRTWPLTPESTVKGPKEPKMVQGKEYPHDYAREGWQPVWGWAEFVLASGRTDNSLRYLRDNLPDFPEPVYMLTLTPLYSKKECEEFLINHPKQERRRMSERDVRKLNAMLAEQIPAADIAEELGVTPQTVYRHQRKLNEIGARGL